MKPMLHEQVCYALYSTSGVITQTYRSLLKPLNLMYPQFVVLMALCQKDNVAVTELAITVGLSKQTMTSLLQRIELLGYLTREFEPGDDRQKRISLTELGKSLELKGNEIAKQALSATGLSNDEAEQLIMLSNKVKTELV